MQIENAQKIEEFLREKYTNEDLYGWMTSEVSSIYFQSYQLAYDLAKRAEKAYRLERGVTTSNFIQFGAWDSLKKGLLSGERLSLALKQMEKAYLDQNKREYELTKPISLLLHDPLAFLQLKETGLCEFALPEALFDCDYPGHYLRRLKTVGLTIPSVTGPYTSINCTLTLLSHKTRKDGNAQQAYLEQEEDKRFAYAFGAVQSIATSHAQNDSGLFEVNFHDERYLPFEFAGAISRWRLEMPPECNQFDFNTIADVILHLRYTARDGGDTLKNKAKEAVVTVSPRTGVRLFSAKHEFSTAWYQFFHPAPDAVAEPSLFLKLDRDRFPTLFPHKNVEVTRVELFGKFRDDAEEEVLYTAELTPPAASEASAKTYDLELKRAPKESTAPWGKLYHDGKDVQRAPTGEWILKVRRGTSDEGQPVGVDEAEDIFIACYYSATS